MNRYTALISAKAGFALGARLEPRLNGLIRALKDKIDVALSAKDLRKFIVKYEELAEIAADIPTGSMLELSVMPWLRACLDAILEDCAKEGVQVSVDAEGTLSFS